MSLKSEHQVTCDIICMNRIQLLHQWEELLSEPLCVVSIRRVTDVRFLHALPEGTQQELFLKAFRLQFLFASDL